jgi:hypothetical protein
MSILSTLPFVVFFSAAAAAPALAQRFPFERSFDVTDGATLDVSTIRGKIDVTVGEPGRVVVSGTVTARVGWNVVANGVEIARNVAANPPVEQVAQTIRLRVPDDPSVRRAVTVSYQVQVPENTKVVTVSDSGATTVRGVSGAVAVRTQSGAIELSRLGGSVDVTTGSGAVRVDTVSGPLSVNTSSSSFVGRSLGNSLRARTGSGSIDAELSGDGDAHVESSSSAIRIEGVAGGITASSSSGHISVNGVPGRPWTVRSGSGGVDVGIDSSASFNLDASTGSGSINVEGAPIQGSVSKQKVSGSIGSGGASVRLTSRSGSIHVRQR